MLPNYLRHFWPTIVFIFLPFITALGILSTTSFTVVVVVGVVVFLLKSSLLATPIASTTSSTSWFSSPGISTMATSIGLIWTTILALSIRAIVRCHGLALRRRFFGRGVFDLLHSTKQKNVNTSLYRTASPTLSLGHHFST